ncbi:hypothetical protein PR048_000243 [Dryococelus australis]|uniref:Uncharacterized protein n=1 Tax=Dryococelus australis TaxID=614101 RepID=A0ABQ9IEZ9_9NEOP|nr:hypothetical protein PR048_000243 [Dryococelus australis]
MLSVIKMFNISTPPPLNLLLGHDLTSLTSSFSTLHNETGELFPEVLKVLRLFLGILVPSEASEWRYFMLKRLNYFGSVMNQERINHLAVLNTYQGSVGRLDIKEMCCEFVNNDYHVQVDGK